VNDRGSLIVAFQRLVLAFLLLASGWASAQAELKASGAGKFTLESLGDGAKVSELQQQGLNSIDKCNTH
jgi:hypothetical protein